MISTSLHLLRLQLFHADECKRIVSESATRMLATAAALLAGGGDLAAGGLGALGVATLGVDHTLVVQEALGWRVDALFAGHGGG